MPGVVLTGVADTMSLLHVEAEVGVLAPVRRGLLHPLFIVGCRCQVGRVLPAEPGVKDSPRKQRSTRGRPSQRTQRVIRTVDANL